MATRKRLALILPAFGLQLRVQTPDLKFIAIATLFLA